MNKNLYVDIHILQDVPPANLNRDDSGSPKSARYGGVDRLRVSSQAWKRATRLDFRAHMDTESLGRRTRRVNDTVTKTLVNAGIPEDKATPITAELMKQIGIKPGKKKADGSESGDSAYLFFFSMPQLSTLAEQVKDHEDLWDNPADLSKQIDVQEILGRGHSLDVALFGRMVADLAGINVDASAQVAHAIATHGSTAQFDYFTAVDDAQEKDETGAGMIGTIEFNSATLYRYATVSVPGLIRQMEDRDAALDGVIQFLRSFSLAMPSGKQNTFAAHTRPGAIIVTIRDDQPVNYVSAFEKPVTAGGDGYLTSSATRLAEFVGSEQRRWGDSPLLQLASYEDGLQLNPPFGDSVSFQDLLDAVRAKLDEVVDDE